MFKLNAKSDAGSLFYLLILNVVATRYTRSLNSVSAPTDCYSEADIAPHAHSSPLSLAAGLH